MNDSLPIFILDTKRLASSIESTYRKLLKHNKVPRGSSVSSVISDYHPEVIELHRSVFFEEPPEIKLRLLGNSRVVNYCQETSTLLLLNKKVIGVTLIIKKKYDQLAYVYAVIIDEDYRHTWANVYLKYFSLMRLLSCGINEIAFQVLNNNLDAIKHIQKVNAKITADSYSWNDYQL